MNSLYHKIAVASICTALSFTLGANQEAKAVTFTLTAPRFLVDGNSEFGGEQIFPDNYVGPSISIQHNYSNNYYETRAFYEFNVGNLSLAPNTVIKRAFFKVLVGNIRTSSKYFFVEFLGYVGNGIPDLSDFDAGESPGGWEITTFADYPAYPLNWDVTEFVNQRVNNGNAFAGFSIRPSNGKYFGPGSASLTDSAELTIETEPVPEPTTIFGSALALGVGGWLKRKKSSQQNKTTSH
jgi:hypothetical protein